jgi:ZIP family zinc transporter
MIYLVLTEFVPEALDTGSDRPGGGKRELAAGIAVGVVAMVSLAFV